MDNIFREKRAALIDMDGVLYDSMPGHTLAWQRMMADVGVACDRDEFYLYEGMTGAATIDLLFRREFGHGCDTERTRALYAVKTRYFRETGPAPMMPGAARMLAALKRGGLSRVLVTGSGQTSLLDSIRRDYPGMFAPGYRVTAHDVTHGKPDPEPYLLGASKAGVHPSQAIVVENAPLGVRAGKAAGCFTIAVTTGPIPRREFEREGADMIFGSMPEFADFLEAQLAAVIPPLEDMMPHDSRVIRTGDLRETLRLATAAMGPDRIFMLTDSNVRSAVGAITDVADVCLTLDPGEGAKSLDGAAAVWRWLSEHGATRHSVLVNMGGGVVTDLGGFCAATFKRGIRFVNVPTTLLGAADAAVGGKTGIDFAGLKNEIGTFAEAEAVIVAPEVLSTLPRREIVSGLAEVVKMAMLTDAALYRRLLEGDALTDQALLAEAVVRAASAKEEIVRLDPREKGLRRILNLGHTFGHAVEMRCADLGSPVTHGEAVAHGIARALDLSVRHEGLPPEEALLYRDRILRRYYSPLPLPLTPDGSLTPGETDAIRSLMAHDKKNRRPGEVTFVLLRDIAEPVVRHLCDF